MTSCKASCIAIPYGVSFEKLVVEGAQGVRGLVVPDDEGDVALAGSLAHHLDVHALPSEHAEDALQDFARLVDVADEREDGVAACVPRLGHALG